MTASPASNSQATSEPLRRIFMFSQEMAGDRSCRACGLGGVQSQLGDRDLPHSEFLDLAGDRSRKLGDEPDVARNLVRCDLTATELAYLVLRRALSLFEPHPRADLLAIFQIRKPDDLRLAHFRMRVQELLDLARIYVLAPTNDHVLDASADVHTAVLTHHGQIARMHPSSGVNRLSGRLWVVPVAEHHRVPARAQLPLGSPGDDFTALRADDLA